MARYVYISVMLHPVEKSEWNVWPTQYIPLFYQSGNHFSEPPLKDFIAYLNGYPYIQEATVRTGRGTTDWFQIGKGVHQSCILSPCLFNFYAEDIMRNAGLEESQAGIKIAGRNINNLRYADDTTLMAESEEEL